MMLDLGSWFFQGRISCHLSVEHGTVDETNPRVAALVKKVIVGDSQDLPNMVWELNAHPETMAEEFKALQSMDRLVRDRLMQLYRADALQSCLESENEMKKWEPRALFPDMMSLEKWEQHGGWYGMDERDKVIAMLSNDRLAEYVRDYG
jgi:hypothetical protein